MIQDKDDYNTIKLIDFGIGDQNKNSTKTNDQYCGTLTFMAPEVARGKQYTKTVDIWAIGIIMHIIYTGGKHPIYTKEEDTYDTFKAKLQKIKTLEPHESFSQIARSLFMRLTSVSSAGRYTAGDALKHPWITRKLNNSIPMN